MAILEDMNGEFHLGNQFTLDTAKELSLLLSDQYRIIVKYQVSTEELPRYSDDRLNVVINTSRETHDVPEEFFRDDIFIIFQHYYMLDKWGIPWYNPLVFPMPLGPFINGAIYKPLKPMHERKYDFSFIGQIPHTGTRDGFKRNLDNLIRETKNKYRYFVEYTDSYGTGLSHNEYLDLLNDSMMVLCPQGAHSLETFRFFETLTMGAIPVIEQLPRLWYYERATYCQNLWYNLDTTLEMTIQFLKTSEEARKNFLYSLANYATLILNHKHLATTLKEKIDIRHKTCYSTQSILETIREDVKQRDQNEKLVSR